MLATEMAIDAQLTEAPLRTAITILCVAVGAIAMVNTAVDVGSNIAYGKDM